MPPRPRKLSSCDGRAANAAATRSYNEGHGTALSIRQMKYLKNLVEQDHRGVKRGTRPMLGFKAFAAAQGTLVGIELMHMLKKSQMVVEDAVEGLTPTEAGLPTRSLKICDRTLTAASTGGRRRNAAAPPL